MPKPLFQTPAASPTIIVPAPNITVTGVATFIGPLPPPSPTVGQFWWRSDTGRLFIYYDDGTSQQWVPATA